MMTVTRHRTPRRQRGKTVLIDIQLWLEPRMPGDETRGWGTVVYAEDCPTPVDIERAIDKAFADLREAFVREALR